MTLSARGRNEGNRGRPAGGGVRRLLGDEFEIKLLLNQRQRVRRRAEWRVRGVGRRVRGRPGQIIHAAAPPVNYTRPAACVGPPRCRGADGRCGLDRDVPKRGGEKNKNFYPFFQHESLPRPIVRPLEHPAR